MRFPVLLIAIVIPAAASAQDATQFFRQNCTSCHTIGGGRLVGPDLKDVTRRQDRAWLQSFIANPRAKLDAADPYVMKLKDDARGAVMPNISGINETIASSLLAMIDVESRKPKSQFAGVTIGDQPFTAADIAKGEAIFTGSVRLVNGGPPCISCHTVQGLQSLGGGRLGPDLTKVYERLQGRKGLASWLLAPATATMKPVFANTAITTDEIVPLVAFLESEARQTPRPDDTSSIAFLFLGLGGSVAGYIGIDAIWRKRFRGVRKPLTRGER